jgi:CheY-like chemotaxis protein
MTGEFSPFVLVVDDEAPDREQIKRVLQRYGVPSYDVPRAFEAIAYLKREGSFADARRPTLVLLDWKLPGTGLSVLRTIRESKELRAIPVVVLSRSGADVDVTAAYNGFANAFVKKNIDLNEFHQQLSSICDLFLRVALLPGAGSQPMPLF